MTTDADLLVNQNALHDNLDISGFLDSNSQPLDALDQTILKHETFIQKLKARRNSMIPISALPPEILCRIFNFAIERSEGVPSMLVALTHVCQSWRNTAIDCCTLWTTIATSSIPWTDEMLKRSGMSRLTITARDYPAKEITSRFRNLKVSLTHIGRIKELSITAFPKCCTQVQRLLADLPVSAPLLETLIMSMPSAVEGSDQGRYHLPPKALVEVNCLRHLQLSRCDVDWESTLFGQLTYLSVEDVSYASRPSATQLSTILQRLPHLRHLALRSCLPIDGRYTYADKGSIHLPRLDCLVLSGKLLELIPWLCRITTPCSSTVKIQCHDPETNVTLRDLLNLLQSPLRSSGIPLSVLALNMKKRTSLQVRNSLTLETKPGPALHLHVAVVLGNPSSFLSEICNNNNIPVNELTCLHITSRASIDPQSIANTLGRLPRLESVLVFDSVVGPFITSLTQAPVVMTASRSSLALAFPQLRQISLHNVTFARTVNERGSISLESLRDCLIERYELGFELERVSVYGASRVSSLDIALLREIVCDIDWDGKDHWTEWNEWNVPLLG